MVLASTRLKTTFAADATTDAVRNDEDVDLRLPKPIEQ